MREDEWNERVQSEQEGLLAVLGLDPSALAELDAEQLGAVIEACLGDPKKRAAVEGYYADHPALLDATQTESRRLECESVRLLERDDAACLRLPRDEVEPWLLLLLERIEPLEARARRKPLWRRRQYRARIEEQKSETFHRVVGEMARAVFAPERIETLVAGLKAYRRELVERGEEEVAALVHAAWMALDSGGENDPAEKPLLTAVCFASLEALVVAVEE